MLYFDFNVNINVNDFYEWYDRILFIHLWWWYCLQSIGLWTFEWCISVHFEIRWISFNIQKMENSDMSMIQEWNFLTDQKYFKWNVSNKWTKTVNFISTFEYDSMEYEYGMTKLLNYWRAICSYSFSKVVQCHINNIQNTRIQDLDFFLKKKPNHEI